MIERILKSFLIMLFFYVLWVHRMRNLFASIWISRLSLFSILPFEWEKIMILLPWIQFRNGKICIKENNWKQVRARTFFITFFRFCLERLCKKISSFSHLILGQSSTCNWGFWTRAHEARDREQFPECTVEKCLRILSLAFDDSGWLYWSLRV